MFLSATRRGRPFDSRGVVASLIHIITMYSSQYSTEGITLKLGNWNLLKWFKNFWNENPNGIPKDTVPKYLDIALTVMATVHIGKSIIVSLGVLC
jgi:hypothetical protein